MKQIGVERENIYRAVFDFFLAVCGTLLALAFGTTAGLSIKEKLCAVCVPGVFTLALTVAGLLEFKSRIQYDETHMIVSSAFFKETIPFCAITSISRTFVLHKTVRGGGHWRWYVTFRTQTGTRKISVLFPSNVENRHLLELFKTLKACNASVAWAIAADLNF